MPSIVQLALKFGQSPGGRSCELGQVLLPCAMPFFICLFLSASVFAIESKSPLKAVLGRFQKAKGVTSEIEKQTEMPLLNEKKSVSGMLYFSKNKFRLDLKDDENTTVVFDGKTLWLATRFEDMWNVLKTNAPSLKRSNSILATLLGDAKALDQLKVMSVRIDENRRIFELNPKNLNGVDFENLLITIDDVELISVKYSDSLHNQIKYIFKNTDYKSSISPEKLHFTLPKKAEVTVF